MRQIWSIVVVFIAISFPVLAQDAKKKSPREELVGVWSGWAVEGKGDRPNEGVMKIELTITKDLIKGKGWKGKDPSDLGEGTFEIHADKGQLDGDKKLDNPNRKEIWLGIYKLDCDTLRWCVGRKGRPAEFETKQGQFLMILKRQ